MAVATLAGRAVSTTLAWVLGRSFERHGEPDASSIPPTNLDKWLDTLHNLAERAAQRRAERKGGAAGTER